MTSQCPVCARPLHLTITGTLFGDQSRINASADPLSLRRHAACFSDGPDGGIPLVQVA